MLKTLSFIKVITIVIYSHCMFHVHPSILSNKMVSRINWPHCKLVVYQSEESVLFLKLL